MVYFRKLYFGKSCFDFCRFGSKIGFHQKTLKFQDTNLNELSVFQVFHREDARGNDGKMIEQIKQNLIDIDQTWREHDKVLDIIPDSFNFEGKTQIARFFLHFFIKYPK